MIAASKQNRAFNFAQLLYFNQGPENSGWLDDTMVASAAKSIPGMDVGRPAGGGEELRRGRPGEDVRLRGHPDGLTGTPTVLVGPSGGKLTVVSPGREPSFEEMKTAIDAALAQ